MAACGFPSPIAEWIRHLERQGRSPKTVANYALDLQDFYPCYRASEETDPASSAILPRDIEDYQAFLQTVRKAAPCTVNCRLATLSHFFKWVSRNDLARQDPTEGVRFLRLPPRKPRALSSREERRLRRAVEAGGSSRDRAVVAGSGGRGRMLEKYAHLAGLEGVTPHVLRNTFATRYLEANPGDLRGLASLLGHASLNTVMVYTEPGEEDLLEKMERMGAAGRPGSGAERGTAAGDFSTIVGRMPIGVCDELFVDPQRSQRGSLGN